MSFSVRKFSALVAAMIVAVFGVAATLFGSVIIFGEVFDPGLPVGEDDLGYGVLVISLALAATISSIPIHAYLASRIYNAISGNSKK